MVIKAGSAWTNENNLNESIVWANVERSRLQPCSLTTKRKTRETNNENQIPITRIYGYSYLYKKIYEYKKDTQVIWPLIDGMKLRLILRILMYETIDY